MSMKYYSTDILISIKSTVTIQFISVSSKIALSNFRDLDLANA